MFTRSRTCKIILCSNLIIQKIAIYCEILTYNRLKYKFLNVKQFKHKIGYNQINHQPELISSSLIKIYTSAQKKLLITKMIHQ